MTNFSLVEGFVGELREREHITLTEMSELIELILNRGVIDLGYISELRKKVGTQPIIMVGVTIIVLNEEGEQV